MVLHAHINNKQCTSTPAIRYYTIFIDQRFCNIDYSNIRFIFTQNKQILIKIKHYNILWQQTNSQWSISGLRGGIRHMEFAPLPKTTCNTLICFTSETEERRRVLIWRSTSTNNYRVVSTLLPHAYIFLDNPPFSIHVKASARIWANSTSSISY